MDCASNNSPQFDHDDDDDNNVDPNVNANYCGGVNNADAVVIEQINKASTSGDNDITTTTVQETSPSMMITTMIVKGKRTKRQQRLHSPTVPSAIPIGDDLVVAEEEDDEEQLDMANCLILLAQGQSRPSSSPPLIRRNELGLFTKLSNRGGGHKRSYSSSVAGIYECKTCNRTFASFQALGGHRASHKKLKITAEAHDFSPAKHLTSSSSPLSLQLGIINYGRAPLPPTPTTAAVVVQSHINNKSSNKVHECSICGAEFSSGQALGGHMRRHRGPVIPLNSSTTTTTTTTTTNNPITNTTLSLSTAPITIDSSSAKINPVNNNGFLSLDLNLPASPDHHDETKFSLGPKQPQSPQSGMVFSTPALVDCFY
ncbi:hypothetical protein QQ045_023303 [Rhodiola kirilowii]